MTAARELGPCAGAANCNAVPWGSWGWTRERVVALLVLVALVGEAHGGCELAGLGTLAWVLLGHGPDAAWRVLGVMRPASVGGWASWHCARLALLAAGALDTRAAALGRVRVVRRRAVLLGAWHALRAAGVPREVCRGELAGLVRAWAPRDGSAWVELVSRGWR